MSEPKTPKYVVDMKCAGIMSTPAIWKGRATEKRLREYLEAYNDSIRPGSVNHRVAEVFGYENSRATSGYIRYNVAGGAIVAEVVV